jgi:hypothetical protein
MFHGAKSSVRKYIEQAGPTGDAEPGYRRDGLYGLWEEPSPRLISYAPEPKRASAVSGPHGEIRLLPWELPMGDECASVPYRASEIGMLLEQLRDLEDEQPMRESLSPV